ncbi:WXG100-like domain-containing protein [Saccharopolyspora phatthalungensis]|uniref:Outer membrane channel protein CpnT-like N-terminal domain-containing protein n=1 Tax=Saccharopolyspora phatthalungensis TaxID=664693 RepID=A0A840QEM2_9PSEU|nr:hypothetical protein [Saccharopolyspora phatthalungensis]MBB5158876.1 hypothetical protein [Saccharopolyspora phatthalungensis]
MSVLVPEEVRRLFQVLTGEDMTDADEDALFAVAERLESGAVAVEVLGPVVGEVVGRVRGGFSGKAADRFAERLEGFSPVLEAGGVGLRELAGFVRNLALQVQYLKFVTVGGLLLLLAEVVWAVAMAGVTAGASMAWLAARFVVMRFLLSRWWGQLFVRLAVAQVVGVGLQLVVEVGAQGAQFALGTRKKWDGQLTTMAVGVGSFSALLAVPLSVLGNVVGNAITKVLVRGLGDEIDAEVLAAVAKHAVEEHAQLYPVSSMARFAGVVSKNIEDYTGMSVRAMWAARFGHGLGESLEEGLTEMLGEAGYGALSGQGAQWNPFSFTAGLSGAVGSGVGNIAGLAVRGELVPAGRAGDAAGGEKGPLGGRGLEGLGTPPPYSLSRGDFLGGSTGYGGVAGERDSRAGTPPPAYGSLAGDAGAGSPRLDDHAGFAPDGSRPRPVEAPGWSADADREGRAGLEGVASSSTRAPEGPVGTVVAGPAEAGGGEAVPVGAGTESIENDTAASGSGMRNHAGEQAGSTGVVGWSESDLRREVQRARLVGGSRESAVGIVRGTHDVVVLARGDVGVSLEDVVILVAVRVDEVGRGEAVRFSRELADRLGTRGTGLAVRAGAGPDPQTAAPTTEEPAADEGSGVSMTWEFDPAVESALDSMEVAGWSWGDEAGARSDDVEFSGFGASVASAGAMGSTAEGAAESQRRLAEIKAEGGVSRSVLREQKREEARVEARRALDAGEPYTGAALGKKFGKSTAWGTRLLAEIKAEGGAGRSASRGQEGERLREEALAEARRARDAGEPYTGAALGTTFGKSTVWGWQRLEEIRAESGVPWRAVRESERERAQEREEALVEARRARDAGEPYTGAAFGAKFGKSTTWGHQRLAEIRAEGGAGRSASHWQEGERLREEARVEARRARDAGEPYSSAALGNKFGKGKGWGHQRLAEIRVEGGASRPALPAQEPDPQSDVPVFEDRAGSGQVRGAAVDPADDLALWGFDPAVEPALDSMDVAAQGWGDMAGAGWDEAGLSAFGEDFDVDVADFGFEGMDVGESSGRKRGREESSVDEGADRRPAGPQGSPILPEARGGSAAVGGLSGVEPWAWGVDEVPGEGVLDLAASGGYLDPEEVEFFGFGAGVADGGVGAMGSRDEGAAELPVDFGGVAVGSEPEGADAAERPETVELLNEKARAEARRARDAGEPYSSATLAKKFGKGQSWGKARLAEIKDEKGLTWSALQEQEWAGEREAARVEARRARDAGEPYSSATLAKKFGKGQTWGRARLEELRVEGGVTRQAAQGQELEREREAARVEARRARDAGESYSGATLGKKFGKSAAWGLQRLSEIKDEDGSRRSVLQAQEQAQEQERLREAGRVEARRARDAGEPYTNSALGKRFGKSDSWGKARLMEITNEGAGTRRTVVEQEGERLREAARVEARRARDAGEPYTSTTLGKKFGKSRVWGHQRLAEIRDEGGATWSVVHGQEGQRLREEARAEARRARDAGEPYSTKSLGKKFGKSAAWGKDRLDEIAKEVGGSAGELTGSGGGVLAEGAPSVDVDTAE